MASQILKHHEETRETNQPIESNLSGYAAFVQEEENGYSITLQVEGMHCAACMVLIENALSSENDVTNARVNFSTKRLTLEWNSEKENIEGLVKIVEKLGYRLKPFDSDSLNNEDEKLQKHLLRCLAVAGFAAGNIMLFSLTVWSSEQEVMGMATQSFMHYLSMLIALPVIIYSGQPFFKSAYSVLKELHTNMDVPISLAIILATAISVLETINQGEHTYFDSALMLLFFLLIGRYLDARAKGKARNVATQLLSMLSGSATVIDNEGNKTLVAIKDLKEGMIVLVSVGENIPVDGEVIDGTSELDLSMITGETMPQLVKKDDAVFGGTTNISAPIKIKITKASEKSLLSEIIKMMEKAEQGQAKYVRLADKAASLYTPIVHTLGLATLIGWMLLGLGWQDSLMIAVTVLIITCPCALGLAVPVVQVLASGKLMRSGILLKSGDALEKLARIDTAIFDKTGTLTLGKPTLEGEYKKQDFQLAASLAIHSKHPLAKALVESYQGKIIDIKVKELTAKGLQSDKIKLGKRSWCGDKNATNDDKLEIWLAADKKEPVRFTFSDQLKSDAVETISELKKTNISTMMLSGDREMIAAKISQQTGIENFKAEISPIQKCEEIEALKKEGHHVLMVGDGLNDAPALRTANISMSPSTAIDIAQNSADIVFQGDGLGAVTYSYKVAKKTDRLVKQNFALAVIYNMIAIPLAVAGFVTPLIAALAMSGSSLIVILNSFRLNLEK